MYNYRDEMKNDVLEAIKYNYTLSDYETREELEERLNDELWICDSVTGNGSGSYTFNRCQAWEYVKDNMDLLREAVDAYGEKEALADKFMEEDYEWMDVSIRCYLLAEVISDALDELEEEFERDEEEEEEEEEIAETAALAVM